MTDTAYVLITGATGTFGSAVLDNLGTTDLGMRARPRRVEG
jgi:FlaA1/EpsC-like NDP-sugar epimerase